MIKVDVVGLLPLKKQISLLAMSPKRRRRLLARVAKKIIRDSKTRVREQRDLKGKPFAKRYKQRSKNRRKMLSRLVKQLKVTRADGKEAIAGFNNSVLGRIASDHQYGKKTVVTAASFSTRSAESYNLPATRKQAKAMVDAGYMVKRANGKGKKKPSIKQITENFTQGQAGSTLKKLREWSGEKAKNSWVTTLPARSFLGATGKEVQQHIETIFDDMKKELSRGIR